MQVERAAHVDHRVTHAASVGQIGLGIAGVVVGAVVAVAAAPVVLTGAAVATAASTVGLFAGLGLQAGEIVDGFSAPAEAGKLIKGLDSVRLGPGQRPAARAFTDSVTDCHGDEVAQGSEVVLLGPERRPMSRRGDQLRCETGRLAEGLPTLLVGGAPSELGRQTDGSHWLVWWLSMGSEAAQLPKTIMTGSPREIAGALVEALGAATGSETLQAVGGATGLSLPDADGVVGLAQGADGLATVADSAGTAIDLGSQIVTRP